MGNYEYNVSKFKNCKGLLSFMVFCTGQFYNNDIMGDESEYYNHRYIF